MRLESRAEAACMPATPRNKKQQRNRSIALQSMHPATSARSAAAQTFPYPAQTVVAVSQPATQHLLTAPAPCHLAHSCLRLMLSIQGRMLHTLPARGTLLPPGCQQVAQCTVARLLL